MKTVGEIIREKREAKRLSVQQLAKRLGAKPYNIYTWEEDKALPHIWVLCDIADIFECSLDELCGRKYEVY
jgi:transcriptional regulator with XRE-family HTH domain